MSRFFYAFFAHYPNILYIVYIKLKNRGYGYGDN